jgi:XTP/dITP diphosphohydrolase
MEREIVIASGNRGKIKEIREILAGFPVVLTSLADYFHPVPAIPEDGATFYENAAGKAQWVFSRTGKPALADDSGLEVDFLGGAPGVRSARFAGEPASDRRNVDKLLSLLSSCPAEGRGARFTCAIVLRFDENTEIVATGVCKGRIGFSPRGTSGFGYDPVFYPEDHDATFAELSAEVKNRISHRGKAIGDLKEQLHGRLIGR